MMLRQSPITVIALVAHDFLCFLLEKYVMCEEKRIIFAIL